MVSKSPYEFDKTFDSVVGRWSTRPARKETLIKSVAQALPTYIMGVFKVPLSVCNELTRMVKEVFIEELRRARGKFIGMLGVNLCNESAKAGLLSVISVSLTKHY